MQEIALAADEAAQLTEHEAVIDRGLNTFVEVGNALYAIREKRLYRGEYGTFEDYCRNRWGMGRDYADRMITAASVVPTIVSKGMPAPANEGQARELSRVPEPERATVWAETVERTEGKPTAAAVRETYEQRQNPATDANLLAGNDWVQSDELESEPVVTPPPTAPKAKRRPLPDALADAGQDLARAAERLARLTEDDRFPKNRDAARHQLPEFLGALDNTTRLITALNLAASEASEEARRWWATSLRNTSDALTDVVNSLEKEL